ncbi:MAG: hypothetical protein R3C14_45800 [Caldilineaceae bacterium]
MEEWVVACVQQRVRIFTTLDDYRNDLQRFLQIARQKDAQLVVFPELAGMMLAPPLLRNRRLVLLKYADWGKRRHATRWQRVTGRIAGWHQVCR